MLLAGACYPEVSGRVAWFVLRVAWFVVRGIFDFQQIQLTAVLQ